MQLDVAGYSIVCDPQATRAAYAPLPVGTGCACAHCRNFDAAQGLAFPAAFLGLVRSLGIDPAKPAELCHLGGEPPDPCLMGGWFHFVGHIAAGDDAIEQSDGAGTVRYRNLAVGIDIGFTRHVWPVAETFSGLAVCQLEFQARIPWVLPGPGISP